MTYTRYLVERLAKAFGYNRRAHRLSDAAAEMHLLREAETHLGERIWEEIEPIEALSNEYWNLRKLTREHKELLKRIQECQARLDRAQEERAELINSGGISEHPELEEQSEQLLTRLEQLSKEREVVSNEGRNVRRLYNGAKTKLEVLSMEGGSSEQELAQVRGRLEQLRDRFNELKRRRDEINLKIQEGDARLDRLNEQIAALSDKSREAAAAAFKEINLANKEVWQLRAECGLVETRMRQLHAEIGRYISRHAFHDATCRAAASREQGLVDVMRALRRSVALNHKLGGTR